MNNLEFVNYQINNRNAEKLLFLINGEEKILTIRYKRILGEEKLKEIIKDRYGI